MGATLGWGLIGGVANSRIYSTHATPARHLLFAYKLLIRYTIDTIVYRSVVPFVRRAGLGKYYVFMICSQENPIIF